MYAWIRALHVIAVISWMAALLYLPRLFVYHCTAEPGSKQSETFKLMERRLAGAIMTPAMIVSFGAGLLMLAINPSLLRSGAYMWVKLALVLGLLGAHIAMLGWLRDFAADCNERPQRFFRFMNEVPTLLMIGIVIMIIVRPF
ncbi:MAG: protoporphyrinogen oxidase HemJ [bacterium]|nr:protoporphyrinogen oxidase HemJ [bacterium]MCP5044551.1 protoporphyrinogen oxidase HemJ [bacterium]